MFERLVSEGMSRMRWTRNRAVVEAKRYLTRLGKHASPTVILDQLDELPRAGQTFHCEPKRKKLVVKKKVVAQECATRSNVDIDALKPAAVAAKKTANESKKKRKKRARIVASEQELAAIAKLQRVKKSPCRPLTP